MISLQELSHLLGRLFPPEEFSDYCPNGLQVEGKKDIRKMGFAVSASLAVIEECVKRGVDVLLVHHGLFWNKDPMPVVGLKRQKLARLLTSQISLFAYHLPLDAHPEIGNNWKAARDLGFTHLAPFGGVGVRGEFAPVSVEAFQKHLEAYYHHPAHVALGGKAKVSSAALISGGAHRSIDQAIQAGVDCFITGSFDEPVWDLAHEGQIHFFALGHYATECAGVRALMVLLEKETGVACEWLDFPNPF